MVRKEFIDKWQKERSFYDKAKVIDVRTGKESNWPYIESVEEMAYKTWIREVVDPATDQYYLGKTQKITVTEDGKEIITTEDIEAHQVVQQICRLRTETGHEFLLSIGQLVGYNEFADRKVRSYSKIEMYQETTFAYNRRMDDRTGKLVNACAGPNGSIAHYLMPFTENNLAKLYAMKEEIKPVYMYCKDEATGNAKQCLTYEMFRDKPFDYIMNDDFLTEREKEQRRADFEALQKGLAEERAKKQRN